MHFSNGARASHGTAPTRPEPALLKNPCPECDSLPSGWAGQGCWHPWVAAGLKKQQGGAGVSLAKLKRQG